LGLRRRWDSLARQEVGSLVFAQRVGRSIVNVRFVVKAKLDGTKWAAWDNGFHGELDSGRYFVDQRFRCKLGEGIDRDNNKRPVHNKVALIGIGIDPTQLFDACHCRRRCLRLGTVLRYRCRRRRRAQGVGFAATGSHEESNGHQH
jgi:hypothetical protein